ncbi:MAG: hypothetical protein IJU54_01750 [Alphaproteobacteria bacterium]|nr:hypothetical protein [Alphaproteobacteria bacterium]
MPLYIYNYDNTCVPSFDQMCKYKTVVPIDFNNTKVKKCLDWLKQNQMPYKLLLEDYLETIYNFAGSICDGVFLLVGHHKLKSNINEFWNRTINDYDFYNIHTDKHERLFNDDLTNRENIIFEQFNVTLNSNELKRSNLAISIIYDLQQKLNPNKYKQSINDIISSNKKINIMSVLYYISNQLVQLSHDVIYAINSKIDKYINNNTETINIDDIIKPLSWTLELVAESIWDGGITTIALQSEYNSNLSYDNRNKFKYKWHQRRYHMYDSAYEKFSVYFQNIEPILDYYKSEYFGVWDNFKLQIQRIQEACSKKSVTASHCPPAWYDPYGRHKDVYEKLSGCLDGNIDWYIIEVGYKIGKLLLENNNTTEDIISVCKKCFEECAEWQDRMCHVEDNEKIDKEEIQFYNMVKNKIEQLQLDTIEKVRNINCRTSSN